MFRVRDFVETREGLLFSVVSNLQPCSGILAQLRFPGRTEGL
jgi:predicted nucleotidyltransferase